MKKFIIVSLLLMTATIILLVKCSTTRVLRCPDGVVRTPYKSPDKTHAEFAKEFDNAAKMTLHILDSVTLTADLKLKSKVVGFRESFTQNTALIQTLIQRNFEAYNNNICDPVARDNYAKFQDFVTACVFQMTTAETELQAIGDLKSVEGQNKLLENLELVISKTNSVVAYGSINRTGPSSDTTKMAKKHIKLFITYHDKYIDNGNLIYNGIIKAFSASKDAEFEYFSSLRDIRKAEYKIVVSSNAIKSSVYLDNESCDYVYSFTLFNIKDNTQAVGIGSEKIKTKWCEEPAREEDVADKFKDISDNLVKVLIQQ